MCISFVLLFFSLQGSAAGQALPLIALVKRVLGKGAKTWRDVRQAIALEQACEQKTLLWILVSVL